jgi:hypothetical protein
VPKRSEENINRIIELYNDGTPIDDICKECGITPRGITNLRWRLGIPVRDSHTYAVNENFFKEWSDEMAWVLGLIITDGCIHPNLNSFSFAQDNEPLIMRVRDVLGSTHPIRPPETTRRTFILNIGSQAMVKDLMALSLTPAKTLTMKFPSVPNEYLPHFIRGVFEGNGWVQDRGYVLNVTSGSKDFAEGLLQVFLGWGLKSRITSELTKQQKTVYRIWVSGNNDVQEFYRITYEKCGDNYNHKKLSRFLEIQEKRALMRKAN